MAARKKTKKRQTKSKRTADNKMTSMKKTAKKKLAMKSEGPKKKLAKKAAQKQTAVKAKAVGKKTIGGKTVNSLKKRVLEKSQSVDTVAFSPEGPETRSGRQSGDLQGLSGVEGADSDTFTSSFLRVGTIRILQSRSATDRQPRSHPATGTFFSTSDTGFIASTTAAAAPPAFGP